MPVGGSFILLGKTWGLWSKGWCISKSPISVSCWAVVRVLHVLRVTKNSTRSCTCCIPGMGLSISSSPCNLRVKTLVHLLLVRDETKHLQQNTTHSHFSPAMRACHLAIWVGPSGGVVLNLSHPRHWPLTGQHPVARQPEGWMVSLRCRMVVVWHWPWVSRLASPGCLGNRPLGWSDPVPCQTSPLLPLGMNQQFPPPPPPPFSSPISCTALPVWLYKYSIPVSSQV